MIQIETTPNPNALKFIANQNFSEIGTREFQKKDIKDIKNDFIKNLLELDGNKFSLVINLITSAKLCKMPNGPTTLGPFLN